MQLQFRIFFKAWISYDSEAKQDADWWSNSTPAIKSYTGFDGALMIDTITGGFIQHMDLALPQTFNKTYDWVLSFNVGEFIPKEFEETYIDNVVKAATKGVAVSWGDQLNPEWTFPNEKSRSDVVEAFRKRGFEVDKAWSVTLALRTMLVWRRRGMLVFRRATASEPEIQDKIRPNVEL